MASLIKLAEVNLIYDKGKPTEVRALKDINLEINSGEYVAFYGPSGCGKTSLLHIIAGIDKPTSGGVWIEEKNITRLPSIKLAIMRQTKIGLIFQSFNLITTLSVLDNVALPMAFLGLPIKERRKRALELLRKFGLEKLANRLPSELSGGQQQRVSIARALANDPPIILADEPIGNLDTQNANIVLKQLKDLHSKEGRTVIMVTHEIWALKDVQKIFFMRDGEIVNIQDRTKMKVSTDKPITIKMFSRLYGGLKKEDLRIKTLTELLLKDYGIAERNRFAFYLKHRLENKLEKDEFRRLLDRPFLEMGVGLWRQTAKKISQITEEIIEKWQEVDKIIKGLEENPYGIKEFEKKSLRFWLTKDLPSVLTSEQKERLEELIDEKIRQIISWKVFEDLLSLPVERGGVGLGRKRTRQLAEKLRTLFPESREMKPPVPGLEVPAEKEFWKGEKEES